MSPWSKKFGVKGLNRIRVYERREGGPIQVEYSTKDGRRRETLKRTTGAPVKDRELACQIAEAMAANQRRHIEARTAADILGIKEPRTVRELFHRIRSDKGSEWSRKAEQEHRRFARFWTQALGPETNLTDVTPAMVARVVSSLDRSPKTRNHYRDFVVRAWAYAEDHLKWIEARHNLKATARKRVPVDNAHLAYEEAEARAILAELEAVDLRAAAVGELAYTAGRRLDAIRTLERGAFEMEDRIVAGEPMKFGVVSFPAETDKAKRQGRVYLFGNALRVVKTLHEKPAVIATGLLFPKGDLDSPRPASGYPITDKKLRAAFREAERRAGVQSLPKRAFHGLKRTFATSAVNDMAAASGQSGTTEATLRRIYRQEHAEEKALLAIALDTRRRA